MSAKSFRAGRFEAYLRNIIKFAPLALTAICLSVAVSASSVSSTNRRFHRAHYVRRHVKFVWHRIGQPHHVAKLHLLTFDQVAQLSQRQRIRYVHLLRQAVVQAEREQIAFHSEHAVALNNGVPARDILGLPRNSEQNLFVMLLMPKKASADSNSCLPGDDCAGRGLYTSDHCIDAGYNSQYPEAGHQQPFQCEVESHGPKINGRYTCGFGALCNPDVFGIPSASQDACVSQHDNYRATQECYGRMVKLAADNRADAHRAAVDAQGFFQLDQCQLSPQNPGCSGKETKISESLAEGESAKTIISNLVYYHYSDDAYAELIAVIEFYKAHGWKIPNVGAGNYDVKKMANALKPSQFESAFNSVTDGVKEIFSGYEAHCNQHLAQPVCDALQKYKPGDYGVHRRVLIDRELSRKKWLAGQTCGPSGTATVRNVLERQECINLDEKYNNLSTASTSIWSTIPIPPAPRPIKPTPHEVDQSYGCANVFRDDSGLFQRAAQCSVCLSENSAYRYGYQLDELAKVTSNAKAKKKLQNEAYKMETYTDSTRWKALLSTMALVCGDSVNNATEVTSETMAHYVETFGQCDSRTYDWPDNPTYDPALLQKIAAITQQSFVDHKPGSISWRQQFKKINPEFKQLFGADVTQLYTLFCNKKRIERRWWGLYYKVNKQKNWQGSSVDWSPNAVSQFKAQGRKQFTHEAVSDLDINPALKSCMNQAITNAHALFPANETCLSTVHPTSPEAFVSAPRNALNSMSAAIIARPGDCFVSHSHSTYDGKEGWEYAQPSTEGNATYQNNPTTGKTIFQALWNPANGPGLQRPALATYRCKSTDSNCIPVDYQPVTSPLLNDYTIIYENRSCRPASENAAALPKNQPESAE